MNNITELDSHILLPHQADFSVTPKMERMWRTGVDQAMGGAEDRSSVREAAWIKLTYHVHPVDNTERARFDDRMRAGRKAGKLAVPYWGKGVKLSAAVEATDTEITLVRSTHGIVAGKHILIQPQRPDQYDIWDACVVDSVASATLTLAAGLNNDYEAGTYVWQLLFGIPLPETFQHRNTSRNLYTVSVQFDQRQINAMADDSFEGYPLGATGTLDGGTGWDGPWVIGEMVA